MTKKSSATGARFTGIENAGPPVYTNSEIGLRPPHSMFPTAALICRRSSCPGVQEN